MQRSTANTCHQYCKLFTHHARASVLIRPSALREEWPFANILNGHRSKRHFSDRAFDWREWMPETQARRLWYKFSKWRRESYPSVLEICNSGADFGTPVPQPHLLIRPGMELSSKEWKMQMYGAALYWHLASVPRESMQDMDEDLLRGRSVLEVGCMRGGGARYLTEVTGPAEYVAVDELAENVALCQRLHAPLPAALRFECVQIANLEQHFSSASFDVVLSVESCAQLEDIAAFICGAHHALRPGGRLIMCDAFTPETLEQVLQAFETTGLVHEVSADLGKWVRKAGTSAANIGESHSMFGIAPVTYLRVVARK